MTNVGLEQLHAALEEDGLDGALKLLNQSTEHRYTAVYLLRDSLLKNVALYDKAGEVKPEYLAEVPLGVSFCQFVLREGQFLTSNSGTDDRLNGHPYQGVMVSYSGVPVTDTQGKLCGTLCHFDVVQRTLSDQNYELLQQAAKVFSNFLAQTTG
ncbi:guanylate cyclase [Hydrogenophaga sp. 2FB]|uniref:GAF domain-containing protein n=1 Tax=Hydrogenophaga sp. 2FB TaxID=2502187 RepID=UPI0010F55750|nr:guanylate cyclase [Hydrogenophaga sp. 2FB]